MNAKTPEKESTPLEGELIVDKNEGILVTDKGLDYSTFKGLWRLANMIQESKLQPKGMDTPSAIAVAIARGRSLGLDPFQSMESFCVINGRAMLYGNTPLALARQHPAWQESGFQEYFEIKGERVDHPTTFNDDTVTAICITQRKGGVPYQTSFSVLDAKRAGLWGKEGKLYGTYPQRMLKHRARGYNLADNFGDALKGICIRETFDEEIDGKPHESKVEKLNKKIKESPDVWTGKRTENIQDKMDLIRARNAIVEHLEVFLPHGRDEILKKASHTGEKWLELSDLETCDNLAWLQSTLEKLRG